MTETKAVNRILLQATEDDGDHGRRIWSMVVTLDPAKPIHMESYEAFRKEHPAYGRDPSGLFYGVPTDAQTIRHFADMQRLDYKQFWHSGRPDRHVPPPKPSEKTVRCVFCNNLGHWVPVDEDMREVECRYCNTCPMWVPLHEWGEHKDHASPIYADRPPSICLECPVCSGLIRSQSRRLECRFDEETKHYTPVDVVAVADAADKRAGMSEIIGDDPDEQSKDPLAPCVGLLIKLASIVVLAQAAAPLTVDVGNQPAIALLNDPEVIGWLEAMDFRPKQRQTAGMRAISALWNDLPGSDKRLFMATQATQLNMPPALRRELDALGISDADIRQAIANGDLT